MFREELMGKRRRSSLERGRYSMQRVEVFIGK